MAQVYDSSAERARSPSSPSGIFSANITKLDADKERHTCTRVLTIFCGIAAILFLLTTIALAIVVGVRINEDKQTGNGKGEQNEGPPTPLQWPQASGSLHARYKRAAIATDHGLCSEIGRDVLFLGGNAIDATIAALICIGVVNPQSSGLGGGFLMTIYNSTTGRCMSVDARETAPAAANESMFVKNPQESVTGYRSIATPSELHGFWTVFRKFGSGKVSWLRLLQPSIDLALNGFPVSSNLAMVLADKEDQILAEPSLKRLFMDPSTERVYEEGDLLKRDHLGFTLELLANSTNPIQLFYQGGLAQTIAAEISEHGGLVTLDDLKNYETQIEESPVENDNLPGDLSMCGPPPPSSFAITQSIIAVMAEFYAGKNEVNLDDPLVYHRLIEAEKFAYAQRTRLGDAAFVKAAHRIAQNMTTKAYTRWIKSLIKETAQPLQYYSLEKTAHVPDHGTSHVTVIDDYENAVSCTSTVNQLLGSMRVSPTLGIIWNDEMDDFSTPGVDNAFGFAPSEANYIAPGKRPMSSMSPTIIYNKNTGKVKMAVGASGGSMIISSTAQTAIRALFFNQTIKEAVDAPRLHNQFLPHVTQYENTIPQAIIDALIEERGQNMTGVSRQKSVVQALELRDDGFIHGNSDFRRQTATYPAGF